MPSVGTAYVNIRVSTKSFETSLDSLMKRLSTKMEKAGTDLGKDFERGLNKSAPDAVLNKWAAASERATSKIKDHLQSTGDKMDGTVRRMTVSGNGAVQVIKEVGVEADSTSKKIGGMSRAAQNASRSMSRIGGGGGGGGMRTAGNDAGFLASKLKELSSEAESNLKMLHGLHDTAAFLGTGMAGIVGGLSAAAQGIFTIGANAAAAAPAVGILANGLMSLGQVGAVAAIASKGVGEALKAGFTAVQKSATGASGATKALAASTKRAADAARRAVEAARRGVRDAVRGVQDAQRAVADAARGVQDAMRGVADAKQSLKDAYAEAARAASDAARRTSDAEQTLAAAQQRTTAAQVALNAAWKEGREQLEDIGFAAEDAGMAEERASLALQDAYRKLQAVSELPPDNRSRVEAELNMRQATDRREDADKAQQEAAKNGVEGTDAVRSASEDLANAHKDEAGAARDVADARREETQTAEDNARRIKDAQDGVAESLRGVADAQRGVADAQRNLADAHQKLADAQQKLRDELKQQKDGLNKIPAAASAAATAVDNFKAAMAKLGPEQKKFVNKILGMRDDFQKFRNAIAEPLFERLNTALDTFVKGGMLGVLQKGLEGTAAALGDTAKKAATLSADPVFKKSFGDAMSYNNEAIGHFGGAGVKLADAFVQIADAGGPLFKKFSQWVETLATGWDNTLRLKNQTGELGNTINTAGDRVSEFWGLAKQLWRTLMILGGAANDAANEFKWFDDEGRARKGYIPSLTESLKDFNKKLDTTQGRESLFDRFTQSLKNLNAAGGAIKTVLQPFIDMGSDPQIATAFDTIAKSDAFDRLGATAGDAVPELADLVVNIADFIASISDTGSFDVFLGILVDVSGALADIAGALDTIHLTDEGSFGSKLPGFNISLLKLVGYVTGGSAALRILWKVFKIGASPVVGAYKGIGSFVDSVKNIPGTLTRVSTQISNFFKRITGRKDQQKEVPAKPDTKSQTVARENGVKVSQAYAQGIEAGMTSVEAAMKAIETTIRQTFTRMQTRLVGQAQEVGAQVMFGLTEGLKAGAAEAEAAASAAGGAVARAVGKGAGTASPSRITMPYGEDVMAGLQLGIKEGTVEAELAAKSAGASVAQSVATGTKGAQASVVAAGNDIGDAVTTGVASGIDKGSKGGKIGGSLGRMGKVFSGASKVMSVAMRGLGGAMNFMMGPWGMLIMILLPLLMPLLKKLNDKFHITDKIMAGLKWTLDKLKDAFGWLWDKIKELFGWVKNNWPLLLEILTGPIGLAVAAITKNWDKIKEVVSNAVDNVKKVLGKIWDGITAGWNAVATFFATLWPNRIKPTVDKLVDNARKRLINFFKGIITGWTVVGTWIANLWRNKIKPKIDTLIENAKKKLTNIWNGIKGGWQSEIVTWLARLWTDKVRPKINELIENARQRLVNFFNGIKGAWTDIKSWLDDLWPKKMQPWVEGIIRLAKAKWEGFFGGLISGLKSVAKTMVGKLNSWLIDPINKALGKFNIGFKIPTIPLPEGLAEGGLVRGPGGPRDDKVVKRLSNGEYVLPTHLTKSLGPKNLDYLRKHGTLPPGVGGTGGLWGSVTGTVSAGAHMVTAGIHSLGDALKKGLSAALSWLVDRAANVLPNNFSGNMVLGIGKQLALAFKPTATRTDAAAAAAAASAATSHGSGPSAVWRALRSIGLSMVQAAGVMGNMQSESGFDPYIVQGGGRSLNPASAGSMGYGLVQWTPGSKLIPYLRGTRPSINAEVTALGLQLQGRGPSPEGAAGRLLKAATTVEAAARAFELGYERHAGGPQPSRISQALAWYNKFKGSDAAEAAGSVAAAAYTGSATGWTYPVPSHTHTYNFSGHNPPTSLDLGVPTGTPVRAASGGNVALWRDKGNTSYGLYVVLNHANGWQTIYAHLSRLLKKSGGVRPGQLLGYSGASGGVTGPHLHMEITRKYGSAQSSSTHSLADARGLRWPYRYGGAWAKGGVIGPQSDGRGVLALLAEAGKAERITPLDSEGFTPAERRMLEVLGNRVGSNGGGDTYHVHPSQSMNEAALADMVARRVAWKRRRGAGAR